MALSQRKPANPYIRSMASQNQSQRETSPQSSRSRRTPMACVRCRGRKVKCIPLGDQGTCQRCCDGGVPQECEFISVTEEENRSSRPQDQEPAPEDHAVFLTGPSEVTTPGQSPGRMPRLGDNVASSAAVPTGASLSLWSRDSPYFPAPPVDPNTSYPASHHPHYAQVYRTHGVDNIPAASFPREGGSHAHGGLWPSLFQGHGHSPTFAMPSNAASGYAYNPDVSGYSADQEMRAALVTRNPAFPCETHYPQDGYDADNQGEWYNSGA